MRIQIYLSTICGGYIGVPRNDEACTNYKVTLNAPTTEIIQSKRRYEQKLTCNITNYNKSCHEKQNVRDNTGPLEDSARNIIILSQCFFDGGRAKLLIQFSVHQRGYWFQMLNFRRLININIKLIVTPEMVGNKIKAISTSFIPSQCIIWYWCVWLCGL